MIMRKNRIVAAIALMGVAYAVIQSAQLEKNYNWCGTGACPIAPQQTTLPAGFSVGSVTVTPVQLPEAAPAMVSDIARTDWQALESMQTNTLNALLMVTGLNKDLDNGKAFYTVLAPLDDAFKTSPLLQGVSLNDLLDFRNRDFVVNLLKNHVLEGLIELPMANTMSSARSLAGQNITLIGTGMGTADLFINDVKVGAIVRPGARASNGMIYIVDRVITPIENAAACSKDAMTCGVTSAEPYLFDGDTADAESLGDINPVD